MWVASPLLLSEQEVTSTPIIRFHCSPLSAAGPGKCGIGMDNWENFSSQEQLIPRLMTGSFEDPNQEFNNILQFNNVSQDLNFNGGFGLLGQALPLGLDCLIEPSPLGTCSNLPTNPNLLSSLPPIVFQQQKHQIFEAVEEKPQISYQAPDFSLNTIIYSPTATTLLPDRLLLAPPPPKKLNYGSGNQLPKPLSSCPSQQHQLQSLHQRKMGSDKIIEMVDQQFQQAIFSQLFEAAKLMEAGNPVLAQEILARLNHQLSPVGKPFHRAAFYFKESMQLLLGMNTTKVPAFSSHSMIFKISAYKSFCEISPIVHFANFTCNQALLEALEGFDKIHIVDFDVGYGGKWASLMQELVLRSGGAPALKITAFASPCPQELLELAFTQESLRQFANEINMVFDIEIASLESLISDSWSLPFHVSMREAVAVNLPIGSFSHQPSALPLVLRFVKQLSPKIVVSFDRGCDWTNVPLPQHIIHALHSYSGLLESLDALNMDPEGLQKIEKCLLQPAIEKILLGHYHSSERMPSWRSLFVQSGLFPLTFSHFTESQAECLMQRTPTQGFHVEKRQSSLILCWQGRELIAASAWRC